MIKNLNSIAHFMNEVAKGEKEKDSIIRIGMKSQCSLVTKNSLGEYVEVKSAVDPEKLKDGGLLRDVISDETIDRHGDIVRVSGWDLKNYKNNPVVLWAHSHRILPVGKSIKIWKGKSPLALKSIGEYPDIDLDKFANTVFRMTSLGYMNSTSVGFIALEGSPIDEDNPWGGWDIEKQELLEYSRVPVPANPNALQCAANEIDTYGEIKSWAEQVLDEFDESKLHHRSAFERAYMNMEGKKATVIIGDETFENVEIGEAKDHKVILSFKDKDGVEQKFTAINGPSEDLLTHDEQKEKDAKEIGEIKISQDLKTKEDVDNLIKSDEFKKVLKSLVNGILGVDSPTSDDVVECGEDDFCIEITGLDDELMEVSEEDFKNAVAEEVKNVTGRITWQEDKE